MVENDAKEPPLYIGCLKDTHTHTRKDGTFLEYWAEELVTQAEMKATQISNSEGSLKNPSATSAPSRILLKTFYLNVMFLLLQSCYFLPSVEVL